MEQNARKLVFLQGLNKMLQTELLYHNNALPAYSSSHVLCLAAIYLESMEVACAYLLLEEKECLKQSGL